MNYIIDDCGYENSAVGTPIVSDIIADNQLNVIPNDKEPLSDLNVKKSHCETVNEQIKCTLVYVRRASQIKRGGNSTHDIEVQKLKMSIIKSDR